VLRAWFVLVPASLVIALASFLLLVLVRIDTVDIVPLGSQDRDDHVYLFVGADSGIKRLPGDEQYSLDERARADVLLLVRLGNDGSVSAVSVPRDVVVSHAGRQQRLALTLLDGPGGVIEGVCTGLGVSVDRYVAIDAAGLTAAIDALGGIEVNLPTALRDPGAGLDLPQGAQRLDGVSALSLVRSRHSEALIDGAWVQISEREGARERARVAGVVVDAVRARMASSGPVVLASMVWKMSDEITLGGGLHPIEWQRMAAAELSPLVLPVEDYGAPLAVRLGGAGKDALSRAGFSTSCAEG